MVNFFFFFFITQKSHGGEIVQSFRYIDLMFLFVLSAVLFKKRVPLYND